MSSLLYECDDCSNVQYDTAWLDVRRIEAIVLSLCQEQPLSILLD